MARGTCGDVDPTHPGYECWTGGKVFNMVDLTGAQIGSDAPEQNFRIWWDGDVLSENLNDNKITKWAYPGMPSGGFSSVTFTGGIYGARDAAPLYGDMFGDWREEVLLEQSDSASMRIYTTAIPTDKRIYTLVHDPEYRNSMCEKGYIQSHMLDYYLGDGMTDPPKPNITYPNATPGGTGGASGSGGANGSGGSGSGGAIASGGTPSTGGATGGRGGRGGSTGNPGTGGTTVVASGGIGTITTGGTPASGGMPGTGGNPTSGGTTVASSGGAGMAGAGGTSAVAPASGGNTGSGAGGAGAGQSGASAVPAAADSGCSCAIGATSGRASAGYLVAMLGMLCLVLTRRRRRRGFRN
jgi:MYXO-CTERM domain-containing protein